MEGVTLLLKRIGEDTPGTFALDTQIGDGASKGEDHVIKVNDALEDLRKLDERLVKVVEMRYFAGLTEHEIAESLGVTERAVRQYWEKARAILFEALK